MQSSYPKWTAQHISAVKGLLDEPLYDQLSTLRTRHGFSLDAAIQGSVDLPVAKDVKIGCVAGDAESYHLFSPLFDRVIREVSNRPSFLPT